MKRLWLVLGVVIVAAVAIVYFTVDGPWAWSSATPVIGVRDPANLGECFVELDKQLPEIDKKEMQAKPWENRPNREQTAE